MIWFTSDLHLGHGNILKHNPSRRTVAATIDEWDDYILNVINQHVLRNDQLYILGDFCWKASKAGHYRQRINCKQVHVVAGNHDSTSLRSHVTSYYEILYRKINSVHFHLSHYPLVSWRGREHGSIHLYGHCHGTREQQLDTLFPGRKAMDVGVDSIHKITGYFQPISLEQVVAKFQ